MQRLPLIALLGVLLLSMLAGLTGCQEKFIVTPYVARNEAAAQQLRSIDPSLQTPDIPVLYVTDREPVQTDDGTLRYGHGRAVGLAFGEAVVSLTPEPTWDELVRISSSGERDREYTVRVSRVTEHGRFSPFTEFLQPSQGRLIRKPDAFQLFSAQLETFHNTLRSRLALTDRKEVVIFIHGFANQFDDAAIRLAQAWHMGGRVGVPIVYTWPAGSGGLLGYAYDRESGEFTVVHLKQLLYALATCPEVEKVHIISHSRGTDVAFTTLREINAELRGLTGISFFAPLAPERGVPMPSDGSLPGKMPWELLKLETWILAAPDLDMQVFNQRFFGENLVRAANRVVIYFSAEDKALDWARWLFNSRRRLGELHIEDIPPDALAKLAQIGQIQAINAKVTGFSTHSYIMQHPAAMSDLLLLLRDGALPGSTDRPLKVACQGVWLLDNDYMKPGRGVEKDREVQPTPAGANPFME